MVAFLCQQIHLQAHFPLVLKHTSTRCPVAPPLTSCFPMALTANHLVDVRAEAPPSVPVADRRHPDATYGPLLSSPSPASAFTVRPLSTRAIGFTVPHITRAFAATRAANIAAKPLVNTRTSVLAMDYMLPHRAKPRKFSTLHRTTDCHQWRNSSKSVTQPDRFETHRRATQVAIFDSRIYSKRAGQTSQRVRRSSRRRQLRVSMSERRNCSSNLLAQSMFERQTRNKLCRLGRQVNQFSFSLRI